MARILVSVEGPTEEVFVNEVLAPHLHRHGKHTVSARIIGNARLRGGILPWPSVRRDILRHLKHDSGSIVTTMVDYYGLPKEGGGAWLGRATARGDAAQKASTVEAALHEDVVAHMGDRIDSRRFLPFIVMHEFEGLLFSGCSAFGRVLGDQSLDQTLGTIRSQFQTPEEINDSPQTAPSKRIMAAIPRYQKPLFGNVIALEIGLQTIRTECPHFNGWLTKLESLPSS
jgi:hypothetical protein